MANWMSSMFLEPTSELAIWVPAFAGMSGIGAGTKR
jgi:hypothetical protein